jgi:hypothetical protein
VAFRRLWWLAPLVVLSTVSGGFYLLGIGISGMLAGRRTRRPGAVLAVAGLAWLSIFSALGAAGAGGKYLQLSYGYLVGPHHGSIGALTILTGVLGHPGAAATVAAGHAWIAVDFLVAFGLVGVVSPWGLGMVVVVLVPNLLDRSGDFFSVGGTFQSWPAMPFLLVGTVMVLLRLLEGGPVARKMAAATVVVWASLLVELPILFLPGFLHDRIPVGAREAGALAHATTVIPDGAEVVVNQAVVGRFGQRESVYSFFGRDEVIPVTRRLVVFVLAEGVAGNDPVEGTITAAVRYVGSTLDTRLLEVRSNVHVYLWSPRPGTTTVTLP